MTGSSNIKGVTEGRCASIFLSRIGENFQTFFDLDYLRRRFQIIKTSDDFFTSRSPFLSCRCQRRTTSTWPPFEGLSDLWLKKMWVLCVKSHLTQFSLYTSSIVKSEIRVVKRGYLGWSRNLKSGHSPLRWHRLNFGLALKETKVTKHFHETLDTISHIQNENRHVK